MTNSKLREQQLQRAATLVDNGRPTEAITLLTTLNRQYLQADIEQRLVQLRHEAFARLKNAEELTPWPPAAPDLFADEIIVPEVPRDELNVAALAAGILQHGALIVRGFLAQTAAEDWCGNIDRVLAARDAWSGDKGNTSAQPWFSPLTCGDPKLMASSRSFLANSGSVWVCDSPRMTFQLLELFAEIGIARILSDYFGESPALSVQKWTLRRIPPDTLTGWHQDGAFLGTEVRTVNLWISLSHCGTEAPSLDLIPRRFNHIVETGTQGAIANWSVSDTVADRAREDCPMQRPVFAPGDAILFDQFNLHRTGVSPGMTRHRYAIESWFFAPSHFPAHYYGLLI